MVHVKQDPKKISPARSHDASSLPGSREREPKRREKKENSEVISLAYQEISRAVIFDYQHQSFVQTLIARDGIKSIFVNVFESNLNKRGNFPVLLKGVECLGCVLSGLIKLHKSSRGSFNSIKLEQLRLFNDANDCRRLYIALRKLLHDEISLYRKGEPSNDIHRHLGEEKDSVKEEVSNDTNFQKDNCAETEKITDEEVRGVIEESKIDYDIEHPEDISMLSIPSEHDEFDEISVISMPESITITAAQDEDIFDNLDKEKECPGAVTKKDIQIEKATCHDNSKKDTAAALLKAEALESRILLPAIQKCLLCLSYLQNFDKSFCEVNDIEKELVELLWGKLLPENTRPDVQVMIIENLRMI